jgi:hypothetical protein
MTQRGGERTAAQNERDFPNIVELEAPPNGFGVKLDSMYEFHRQRGLRTRSSLSAELCILNLVFDMFREVHKELQQNFGRKVCKRRSLIIAPCPKF